MIDIKPIDLISFTVLIGGGVMLWHGKDHLVPMVVTAVMAYYYGHHRKNKP